MNEEEVKIRETDASIKIFEEKIKSQRSQMGGINATKENQANIQKQIRILENRLDKAN